MKGKFWGVPIMVGLILVLTSCGQLGVQPTRAAEDVAPVGGGGGGWVAPSGQITEGLVVVGVGVASAEPEIAQITFGVQLRGEKPAAIVDDGAKKMGAAISAVKEMGVAEEDIRTTGYNLWVETVYDPEKGVPTGEVVYNLSHYVQVTLRDLDKVGDLLAAVVEAGANSIAGVSFTVEDPDALVEQARQQALTNAAAQAQQMADGLGVALDKPVLVMETSGGYALPEGIGGGMGGGGMVAAPAISPGVFSVSVSIQVVYGIR